MNEMLIVIVLFIIFLVLVGLLASKGVRTTADEYIIGGRRLNSFLIGISAAATGNSGFIMLGAVGLGYQFGISFIALPIAWFIGDLLFWGYFPHRMNEKAREIRAVTVPEFLSKNTREYRGHISFISAFLLVVVLGSYTASQFTAITKAASFIGYTDAITVILLTVTVVLVYSLVGGFMSSVWTDIFQAFFMFFVTISVLITVFSTNGGIKETFHHISLTNPNLLSIGPPLEPAFLSIVTFFLGWISASLGFGLSQPQVISRYFAGSSEEATKNAKWIYILFLQFTWIGMTLFGVISNISLNKIQDPELALLEYASTFDDFFIAIVFIGVISAVISTLDSMFVSIGGIISDDLIGKTIYPQISNHKIFRPFIVMLFAIAVAIISISSSKTVFELSALAITFLSATIAPAMAYSILKKKVYGMAILASMISGMITFIIWKYFGSGKMELGALIGSVTAIIIAFSVDKVIEKKSDTAT